MPGTAALSALNRSHGPRPVVFAIGGDNLPFYSDGAFFASPFGPGATDRVLPQGATAAQVRSRLASLGATHVLVCPRSALVGGWRGLGAPSWAVRVPVRFAAELYAIVPKARPSGAPALTPPRAAPPGSS